MYIFSQDGRQTVPVEGASNIYKCPCCNSLIALLVNGQKIRLGEYATEAEAYEVFAKLRAAALKDEHFEMPPSANKKFKPLDSICCDDDPRGCDEFFGL